jgi:hypothetical protein
MVTTESEVPQGGAIRTKLISGHPLGREALFPQQLAHELDGRATVSPALKQYIEDLAFVVDRAPDTSACRRSGPPSRRGASDRPAEDGFAAAVEQS